MRAKHCIMDSRLGDEVIEYETTDEAAVKAAMERFNDLVRTHSAARPTGNGTSELVRKFNPEDTEVLFYPRVVGG